MLIKYSVSIKTVFETDASFLKPKHPFNSQEGINQRKIMLILLKGIQKL